MGQHCTKWCSNSALWKPMLYQARGAWLLWSMGTTSMEHIDWHGASRQYDKEEIKCFFPKIFIFPLRCSDLTAGDWLGPMQPCWNLSDESFSILEHLNAPETSKFRACFALPSPLQLLRPALTHNRGATPMGYDPCQKPGLRLWKAAA